MALQTMRTRLRGHAADLYHRSRRRRAGSDGCLICGAPRSPYEELTYRGNSALVKSVSVCSACGYVQIAELPGDRYRSKKSMDELPLGGARIGTPSHRGREFKMAEMALEILGRRGVEVMVYGPGRSMDNRHIAELPQVSNVAIGDIMKLRDDAEFHDVNKPATKRFAVVVASEVIEHFRTPHQDFPQLLGFVAADGLLVCGTNVYRGNDLTRDRYIYYPDHTSYYTPRALFEIARTNRYHVDFRAPQMAVPNGHKRYVLFTKSIDVLQRTAMYFGSRVVAPSE
jgi:hypothetical protein